METYKEKGKEIKYLPRMIPVINTTKTHMSGFFAQSGFIHHNRHVVPGNQHFTIVNFCTSLNGI